MSSSGWYIRVVAGAAMVALLSGCAQVLDTVGMPPDQSVVSMTRQVDDTIIVTWADDSNTADGYDIERSINGGSWRRRASVGSSVRRYVDTTPRNSGTYQYRVRGVNDHGQGSSREQDVVYDGIKGGTVSSAELAVDTDGDGTTDGLRSFPLVDTDGDGTPDGLDIDGRRGTAEFHLTPKTDAGGNEVAGVYEVDTNGDGESDFEYDLAAGGIEGYSPEIRRRPEEGGSSVAVVSSGSGNDNTPAGIDTDGDGTPESEHTDVLAANLAQEGATLAWPAGGDGGGAVDATVVRPYDPDADQNGALDIDGDGAADVWIVGERDPDGDGSKSYHVDASGNGTGNFWINGKVGITANTAADMGSGGSGSEVYAAVDESGELDGFGTEAAEDGSVTTDTSFTDPVADADDGSSLSLTVIGSSGDPEESQAKIVGDPTSTSNPDGESTPFGLDLTGDDERDLSLLQSTTDGVYGVDTDSDGAADLYMQTTPTVAFTEQEDGGGTHYKLVADDRGDPIGFDSTGSGKVDTGFEEDDDDISFTDPGTDFPDITLTSNSQSLSDPFEVSETGTKTVDAELADSDGNTVTAEAWAWFVNGQKQSGKSTSSLSIDPDDMNLDAGRYHTVTVRATFEHDGIAGVASTQITFTVQR